MKRTHVQSMNVETGEVTERVEFTESMNSTSTTHRRFTMINKDVLDILEQVKTVLAYRVYFELLKYEVGNSVSMSVETLAETFSVSQVSIYSAIKNLEELKLIKYKKGRFALNSDAAWSSASPKNKAEYFEAIGKPVKTAVDGRKPE